MNTQEYRSQEAILGVLASLPVGELGYSKTVFSIMDYVGSILDVDRVCAVVFPSEKSARVFRNNALSSVSDEQMERFSRHLSGQSRSLLMGEALLSQLTDEENALFQFRYPIFFPFVSSEHVLGVLWCDGALNEEAIKAKQEALLTMRILAGLVFRNAFFYESHVSHENALMQILDNLDANIYVSDLYNDDILFINKRMSEEFGLKIDGVGQKCWKVLQEGITQRCSFCPSYKLVKDPGTPIVWEEHNTATKKYYKNTDSVIKWLDGRLVHLQHSVDITAEKMVMQNLEEARSQAEVASKAKGDFLSRMSHEIRTPINAIIGMSRIAGHSLSLEKTHDCIRKIDSSSKQLLGIVNDILDMSKIEANKVELADEAFDFESLLIDVSNVISIRAEEKQQKLHIHMDMSMPRFFMGDAMRLSQVITNLLSNAVKFTPDFGMISMYVREKANYGDSSRVEIRIADTGIGIPKERQSSLFQSFEQADGGIARKFGGTGLGLAIARSIVQLMDGDISMESTEGVGSVFMLDVLLKHSKPLDDVSGEFFRGIDVSGMRVLLLDSDKKTRDYFVKIMDSLGIMSRAAASVDECFDVLAEAKLKNESFNIIFVDFGAAPGKGPQLCLDIKKQFGSSIIVLTSMTEWNNIKVQAETYGISKYLSKPFFPSTMMNVINEIVGLPAVKSEVAQVSRYRFTGYHLLLVEDVEINREVVYQALEDTKVQISSAVNGQIALDMVRNNPTGYDLILMDVNMPEMDGYEATRQIRKLPHPWAGKIPILAMTANAFADDVQKSLDSGMNDHITKPLDFDVLFSKLHHYFSQHPRSMSAEDIEEALPARPSQPAAPDARDLMNVEEALKRLSGNTKVYKMILNSFLKRSGFDELTRCFESRDMKAARGIVHAIKGSSGNLSLTAIYQDMVALEKELAEGVLDMERYQASLDHFEKTKQAIGVLLEELK